MLCCVLNRHLLAHPRAGGMPGPVDDWPEGYQLAAAMNFKFPQCAPMSLASLVPTASAEGVDLMMRMLSWNPKHRPKTSDIMRHAFFRQKHALAGIENSLPSTSAGKQSSSGFAGSDTPTGDAAETLGPMPSLNKDRQPREKDLQRSGTEALIERALRGGGGGGGGGSFSKEHKSGKEKPPVKPGAARNGAVLDAEETELAVQAMRANEVLQSNKAPPRLAIAGLGESLTAREQAATMGVTSLAIAANAKEQLPPVTVPQAKQGLNRPLAGGPANASSSLFGFGAGTNRTENGNAVYGKPDAGGFNMHQQRLLGSRKQAITKLLDDDLDFELGSPALDLDLDLSCTVSVGSLCRLINLILVNYVR